MSDAALSLSEAEVAVAKTYSELLKLERETMGQPTIGNMVDAIESAIDAHATAARVSMSEGLPHPATALRLVIVLDAAVNLLRMIEPKRKEVWKIIKPAGEARA